MAAPPGRHKAQSGPVTARLETLITLLDFKKRCLAGLNDDRSQAGAIKAFLPPQE